MAVIVICDRCKKEQKTPQSMVKIKVSSEKIEKLEKDLEICDKCYADLSYTFNELRGGIK